MYQLLLVNYVKCLVGKLRQVFSLLEFSLITLQIWKFSLQTHKESFKEICNFHSSFLRLSCSVPRAAIGGFVFDRQCQRTSQNRKLENFNKKLGKLRETRRKFSNFLGRFPNFLQEICNRVFQICNVINENSSQIRNTKQEHLKQFACKGPAG